MGSCRSEDANNFQPIGLQKIDEPVATHQVMMDDVFRPDIGSRAIILRVLYLLINEDFSFSIMYVVRKFNHSKLLSFFLIHQQRLLS